MNEKVRWYKDQNRVTFENAAQGKAEVIEVNETSQTIILKFKGRRLYDTYEMKYYYEPAEYFVYHIINDSEFKFLARFPVKQTKKEAKQ